MGILALLVCAHLGTAHAQAPSISDPVVMDQLRNRLYRVLNNDPDKAKVQAPERNVLRVTRQRVPTKPKTPEKKPAAPPEPEDPLRALVLAAIARAPTLPDIPLCPEAAPHDPTVSQVRVPAPTHAPPVTRRLKLVTHDDEVSPCPPVNAGPPPLPPPVDWAYLGPGGPDHWGRLRVDFAACMIGEQQSPVALSESIPVEPAPLDLRYRPGRFHVIDDGRTLIVSLDGASTMVADGQRLRLKRIRFHRPGEHLVDGVRPDMSAHLIHENEVGRIVAISVPLMIDRSEGADDTGKQGNPVFQQVLNNIPLDPEGVQRGMDRLDPSGLLPSDHGRFVYDGSLTTPPCTEGVRWLVMRHPVIIARRQYEVFEKLLPASARPLQALNGRRVKGTL
ncbi:MAG: carbonic anhydrase family protein [Burkholderiaceae bacterium]